MQKLLIILGIAIIPFYEIILKALPFVKSVAPDTRAPKEVIALVFALSIGLLAVFHGHIKPLRNKFLLILPVYLLINLIMSPHVDLFINGIEVGNFYFWKPFAEILCFLLMIVAISSMDIKFDSVFLAMVICGAIMAGYVIMQKFGFDQFWIVKNPEKWSGAIADAEIGGNLGQSTVVASFIAMIIPLAFYLKKYWMATLMVVATILTRSDMALLSLFVMIIPAIMYWKKFLIIPMCSLILCGSIFIGYEIYKSPNFRHMISQHSSGRTVAWKAIISDIRDGAIVGSKQDFSFTGVGLGRFGFIFPDKNQSDFMQAHNDLLEFTYNCGFIGLGLLLMALFFMVCKFSIYLPPASFAILLSFITILFLSLGSFPFQLGAHQFYSAILVGLLHNQGVLNDS